VSQRTGIKREDLAIAARHEFDGDEDLVTKLNGLDADGTTRRLLAELYERWPDVAAGLLGTNAVTAVEAVWLGDGRVRIGDEFITLEPQMAEVLQALVELRTATKPQLQERSGRDQPDKQLKKAVKRFPSLAPYIRFPGARGMGGYSTTITAGDS
jgi:hypothetical protein